jgi:hypothetical protein
MREYNGTFIFSFSIINSNCFNMGREIMKNNWDNKTLTEVRKLADKHSASMKNLTDNDLKEFLDIFVKATEKVTKENK